MSKAEIFDIIIAGAGAAGLSLLQFLMNDSKTSGMRVLLADQRLKPERDKTWCFWDDRALPDSHLLAHSWDTLGVRALGRDFEMPLSPFQYHCMRSDDYAREILNRARKSPNVTLIQTGIEDFSPDEKGAAMYTPYGTFKSPYIFQSALKVPDFEHMRVDISLRQHFLGWQIKADRPVFNPNKATFMDFDIPQKQAVTFAYVLPFSDREALVEYTFFSCSLLSEKEYEQGLADYLSDRYDLRSEDYKILYREKGVIPMEDRRYPALYCDRVWNIGTMGGLTKPSSGYTFSRIRQHSARIVDALAEGRDPAIRPASSYRFRVYDIMMLYQIWRHPETAVQIFHDLFHKNRIELILRFLEEKTHPLEEIRLFSSLPWYPFFQSIYKMKRRIFSGA